MVGRARGRSMRRTPGRGEWVGVVGEGTAKPPRFRGDRRWHRPTGRECRGVVALIAGGGRDADRSCDVMEARCVNWSAQRRRAGAIHVRGAVPSWDRNSETQNRRSAAARALSFGASALQVGDRGSENRRQPMARSASGLGLGGARALGARPVLSHMVQHELR
jgi:hypothetical protein